MKRINVAEIKRTNLSCRNFGDAEILKYCIEEKTMSKYAILTLPRGVIDGHIVRASRLLSLLK